jgi:hypothetical protein
MKNTMNATAPTGSGAGLNLEIYEPTIRIETTSVFGNREEMVPHTMLEKLGIGVVTEWLKDNELQEMTVCSTNIGFVKTFRKFYKGQLPPNAELSDSRPL